RAEVDTLSLHDALPISSGWWRLQAQRMLLERQDKSVVQELKDLFMHHKDPRVRLHALYTLEGLSSLDAQIVAMAMEDVHPGVREDRKSTRLNSSHVKIS